MMPARSPRAPAWAAAVLCLASAGALAAPANYRCPDGEQLTADFSPRLAQVRWHGEQWTLKRVRNARQALYSAGKVSIVLNKSDAELRRPDHPPLTCRLIVRSFDANPGGPPPQR